MSQEKEFGKYSRQQLRELFSYHHLIKQQGEEISGIAREDASNLIEQLSVGPLWSTWYELTYNNFLIAMLSSFGLVEEVLAAAKQEDPQQAALDLAKDIDESPDDDIDEYSDDEKGVMTSLFFALHGNINAQRLYSQTMSELVSQAQYDDDSLFNAVLVDRSTVACPTIARRIQLAEIQHDESFLNKLTKAITRTRPRRPASELDDLRLMLDIVEDSKPLTEFSYDELYGLLIEDLELNPPNLSSDYYDGFKKLIQRRKPSGT